MTRRDALIIALASPAAAIIAALSLYFETVEAQERAYMRAYAVHRMEQSYPLFNFWSYVRVPEDQRISVAQCFETRLGRHSPSEARIMIEGASSMRLDNIMIGCAHDLGAGESL